MRSFRNVLALVLVLAAAPAFAEDVDHDYSARYTQLGFLEQVGDRTCAAGDYWIAANLSIPALRQCVNGTITTIGGGGGGGEANTASNVGGGLANWDSKVGVDLRFNTFAAVDFDLASNLISIDAAIARDAEVAAAYQPLDSDLTAIAALTTTAFGRGLLDDADATAGRASLGVVIGTNVQAWDADLDAVAALATTAYGRGFLDRADAAAARAYIGQGAGTDLTADLEEETHASEHADGAADEVALDASQVTTGVLVAARGGGGAALPTCAGTDKLTANGTQWSCATDQTGGGGGAGYADIVAAVMAGF